MEALNAESISKAILGKLEQMGLDYKGCLVGMGFDGASVISGKLGGVQKLIRDKSPMAYYLHCYAHQAPRCDFESGGAKISKWGSMSDGTLRGYFVLK